MNGSEVQIACNIPIYPKDSNIYSNQGFLNSDDGRLGGTHWTFFYKR